jgi:multiple sugar transport system permease protein
MSVWIRGLAKGGHPRIPVSRMARRRAITGNLFILPALLVLFVTMLYPIFYTATFSVSRVTLPTFETEFIGFDNFVRVFSRRDVGNVLRNTAIWVITGVTLQFALGFWAAMVLNARLPGIRIMRVLAMLPWTVPSIVAANLWRWLFQSDYGLLNNALRSVGLAEYARPWLANPDTALLSVMVANAWAGYPFVMLMLLAGLQGIPEQYYEAAKIDGANDVQLFRYITLPGLRSIIVVLLLLLIVFSLNAFDMLVTMTGGGPGGSSEILGLFIYRLAFTNFDFAGASAVGMTLLVIATVLFLVYAPSQLRGDRR